MDEEIVKATFPMELAEKFLGQFERVGDALEKLAADPEIEIEFGPPICPECGKLNPIVELEPVAPGQKGPMLEIVTIVRCTNCQSRIYVVTESFSCHLSLETVREEIDSRRAGF